MGLNIMRTGLLASALLAGTLVACDGSLQASGTGRQSASSRENDPSPSAPPPYRSSVVGTDFDIITEDDPSAFSRLEFAGFKQFEMPDKRNTGKPLLQDAYVFNAFFNDGTKVGIALSQDFGSRQAAEQEALRYTPRLGRLPSLYRKSLKHVVVHTGGEDTTAFAEDKGHFFVIYAGNATKRIGTHDLEETFFHEATHASIQAARLQGAAWQAARARDNAYVTRYAMSDEQEDFAESALLAYAVICHPQRLPAADRAVIEKQIPNRIAYFRAVYTRCGSK